METKKKKTHNNQENNDLSITQNFKILILNVFV